MSSLVLPATAEQQAKPAWFRDRLLPHVELPADLLPVHFIDEKVVTATDLDPQQERFRLPAYGVLRNLRPILTADELRAANLPTAEFQGGQGSIRKMRKGKKPGGLPVRVVDTRAGVAELQLSRPEGSRVAIIEGEGCADFMGRCSFAVGDVVQIWAFKQQQAFPFVLEESPLYLVIDRQETQTVD